MSYCDPNDFSGSDVERINAAIRASRDCGGVVRITSRRPERPGDRDYWLIDSAILMPSDTTLQLDNCRVKLSDLCRDNLIRSANCGIGTKDIPELRNIRIAGIGNAVLEGADDPRATGDAAKKLGAGKGQSYGSDAGKPGEVQNGDWRNIGILLVNVNDFTIENLTIRDSHSWAVSLEFCSQGRISNMAFFSSGCRTVGGERVPVLNQDGLDLRMGCRDIGIDTVTGATGDDLVALTAISPKVREPGLPGFGMMCGGRADMRENDICRIRIRNVRGYCAGGHQIVRFLNASGVRMYDIELDGVTDTSPENFRCRAAVRIGDANPKFGGVTPLGDTCRFTIRNVRSQARRAILIAGSLTDSAIENVVNFNPETEPVTMESGAENVRNVTFRDLRNEKTADVRDGRPEALRGLSRWRIGWVLFWSYIRITSLVLGGGYAIIAAAQEEFVRRRKWLTEDDVLEMITVTQTVPGILACNSAVYVGWKLGGLPGAVAALAGAAIPSLVIIIAIAAVMSRARDFIQRPAVRGAFIGLIACIVGMVLATAVRMWKKVMKEPFAYIVAACSMVGLAVLKIKPAWLILGAIAVGIATQTVTFLAQRAGKGSK